MSRFPDYEKWYSPSEFLNLSQESVELGREDKKAVDEGIVASILALGLIAWISGNKEDVLVKLCCQSDNKAPDAILKIGKDKEPFGVEVVTYTEYTVDEPMEDFLARTKFAPEIAYPENTVILCHVKVCDSFFHDFEKIREVIAGSKNPYTTFFLYEHEGKSSGKTLQFVTKNAYADEGSLILWDPAA